MELRFSPLFSGSSGNATYVGCDDAHILVDAGLSGTRVSQELMRVGVNPGMLSAILVTHEHSDHIKGIGILSRKFDLPVFATEGTWREMYGKIGAIFPRNMRIFEPGQDFYIGSIDVTPFSTPHDAGQPVGYTFEIGGAKLAIATDLGEVAAELARNGTRQIILGHLSKENNYPELALQCTLTAMKLAGVDIESDVRVMVASRDGSCGMFSVTAELQEMRYS